LVHQTEKGKLNFLVQEALVHGKFKIEVS